MVYAFTTSGLGNRLASIITGLFYSRFYNRPFKIVWSPNDECDCSYGDLFSSHNTISVDEFIDEIRSLPRITVCGFLEQKPFILNHPALKENLDTPLGRSFLNPLNPNYFLPPSLNIVYNSIFVPSFITKASITSLLSELKINENILLKVNQFIKNKNINRDTRGLVLRKTDASHLHAIDDNKYMRLIQSNQNINYFISSDDMSTELTYNKLPNVICYPKLQYVTYNEDTHTLHRTRQSVIEAFISLLILSRTNMVDVENKESSFYKSIIMYQEVPL